MSELSRTPIPSRTIRPILLFVAGISLFAAGCAVGPNYKRPDVAMPASWVALNTPSTQASVPTKQQAVMAAWWEDFKDPILNRLIVDALVSNLDVAQATARVRQARAQRAISAGGLWPSVDVAGSYRRSGSGRDSNTPTASGVLGTTGSSSNDQWQVGFDAAWELDVFGGQRREIEANDARVYGAIADLQDIRITLMSEVAINYVNLRTAQRRYAIAENNLAIQQQSLSLTEKQVAAGFADRLGLAQAEAQIASTRAALPALRQTAQTAIFDLALLLGRQPGALMDQLTQSQPIPTTPPEVPAGLPSDLLRRRPDIRRAEAGAHAATANIGVATADLFPRFTLTGSFGTEDTKARRLLNWGNTIWSFGPNVSWNIFDGGRIRANISLAEAQRDETLSAYYSVVLTALRDVEVSLTAYEYEQQRWKLLQTAVDANRRSVDLAKQLYAQGQTEFVNVLTAQQSLLSSEDALAQSEANVSTNLVSIYKAVGGGWDGSVEATTQPSK